MRIIALGDAHGRTDWKRIIENETFDKIVFIGDYFDTHENISPEQQKENFLEIVSYKKENMDKVVLLIENHDYHYLRGINETYSGFQEWQQVDILEMLHSALDNGLMQMCFKHDKFIFTHAGITRKWLSNAQYTGEEPIDIFINDLFKYTPLQFKFTSGRNFSMTGDDIEQSPIWVRPNSLLKDGIEGVVQIVGHTTKNEILITDEAVFIDTLGTSGEYLVCDNLQLSVKKI